MPKRVVISRKEFKLTDEEAKQFILNKVFNGVGHYFILHSFLGRIQSVGLEESKSKFGELRKLVNQLIHEGKLGVECDYFSGPGGGPGDTWIIKRIV